MMHLRKITKIILITLFIICSSDVIAETEAETETAPTPSNTNGITLNAPEKEATDNTGTFAVGAQASTITGIGFVVKHSIGKDWGVRYIFGGNLYSYRLDTKPKAQIKKKISLDSGLSIHRNFFNRPVKHGLFSRIGGGAFVGGHFKFEENKDGNTSFDNLSRTATAGIGANVFLDAQFVQLFAEFGLMYEYKNDNAYRHEYKMNVPSYQHQIIPGGGLGLAINF